MRISDWSSDVCSSDLLAGPRPRRLDRRKLKLPRPAVAVEDDGFAGQRALGGRRRHGGRAQWNGRSEERRVGKECGSTCRSPGEPNDYKQNQHDKTKLNHLRNTQLRKYNNKQTT